MADDDTVLKPDRTRADATLAPGVLVLHTYRVERLLNQGGMGEVYLARHAVLGTQHAIKVIKPELITNPMVLELSQREAKVLRDIRNDAVVGYEGFLQDDTGHWYLCMEYVEGPSLAELLERGPLPLEQVYRLRDRLVTGLAATHARGVVHRDISPDNVILPDGRVENAKLIDFGIAKLTLPGAGTIIANTFAGKLRYASPEQLGLFGGEVDARSDLYSLGLVLAAAARGNPLSMGDSYETACQARQRVPELSGIPAALQLQLTALLQPHPRDRPGRITELPQCWPTPGPGQVPDDSGGVPELSGIPAALQPQLTALLQPHPRDRPGRITELPQRWPTPGPGQVPDGGDRRVGLSALGVTLALLLGGGIYWWLQPAPLPPPTSGQDLAAIAALPPEEIDARASQFYQAGRLQEALGLWEIAAPSHGPAALQLGALYDPVLWGKVRSPFSKPNPTKAEKWYRQAQQLGVEMAASRLQALANWRLTHPGEP